MLSCPTCSSVNSKRARCYDMSSNTNTPSSIKVLPIPTYLGGGQTGRQSFVAHMSKKKTSGCLAA
eukprot:TRINITY_DN262_c0_g1_i4.p2 TRINITY_DN262_c0_g1~~TRINITY_DN262_c0_g1_i4.p2  ORF type:complete len:65 (+),score=4.69 TRINITY_DN262_c0_g1_i4:47-241(+)